MWNANVLTCFTNILAPFFKIYYPFLQIYYHVLQIYHFNLQIYYMKFYKCTSNFIQIYHKKFTNILYILYKIIINIQHNIFTNIPLSLYIFVYKYTIIIFTNIPYLLYFKIYNYIIDIETSYFIEIRHYLQCWLIWKIYTNNTIRNQFTIISYYSDYYQIISLYIVLYHPISPFSITKISETSNITLITYSVYIIILHLDSN